MSMMNEIEKLMNDVDTSFSYRVINLGGKSLYIEGIKSVICFDENEMRFQLKSAVLKIEGRYIKVKYLDKTSCVLKGEIRVVEVVWKLN